MYGVGPDNGLVRELVKVRVRYRIFELTSRTRLQALVSACTPTSRVLHLQCCMPFSAHR